MTREDLPPHLRETVAPPPPPPVLELPLEPAQPLPPEPQAEQTDEPLMDPFLRRS